MRFFLIASRSIFQLMLLIGFASESYSQVVKKNGLDRVKAPQQLRLSFTTPDEGEEAVLVFELDRSALWERVTFKVSTFGGSAAPYIDYEPVSKQEMSIEIGQRYAELRIQTHITSQDFPDRANLTFWVQVEDVVGAVMESDPLMKKVEIQNINTGVLPQVYVKSATNVFAGGVSTVVFGLTRNAVDETEFLISTLDGTAIAGKNYSGFDSKKVTIPKGSRETTAFVYTLIDDEQVGDKFFNVKIVEEVSNCTIGVPFEKVITIRDNDTDYTDLKLDFFVVQNNNPTLGDEVELAVSLENLSNNASSGVVTIPLSDKFTYLDVVSSTSGSARYDASTRSIVWEKIDPIRQETTEQMVFKVRVLQIGTHAITATVESELPELDPANNSATVRINVGDIVIPNVITPNNDGFNDEWHIADTNYFDMKVKIVNRYGVIVYQSDNYQNNWGAENVPDGTYMYSVEMKMGNSQPRYYKGILTVVDKY